MEVLMLPTSPKVMLMAKSKTRTIQGLHALVNSVYPPASLRQNDFAISIKSGQEPNGIKIAIIHGIKGV
jgi:hypothetical protein